MKEEVDVDVDVDVEVIVNVELEAISEGVSVIGVEVGVSRNIWEGVNSSPMEAAEPASWRARRQRFAS